MTANAVTVQFTPGFRLIDGTDLNNAFGQVNAALGLGGSAQTITALNTVGAGTITAAGIVGGVTARGGAQLGSAFTDTTDTAANIIAALGASFPTNGTLLWVYQNNTNAQATLAGGTSVTISGNSVIPIGTWARFLLTKTSATAITLAVVDAGFLFPLPISAFNSQSITNGTTIGPTGLTSAQLATLALNGLATSNAVTPLAPAAEIVSAWPNAQPGASLQLTLQNNGTATVNLTGLTNTTITGTTKIQTLRAQSYNVSIGNLSSVHLTGITQTTLS